MVTLALARQPSWALVVDTRVTHMNLSTFYTAEREEWRTFAHPQRSVLTAMDYHTYRAASCPEPEAAADAYISLSPYGVWRVELLQGPRLRQYKPYALTFSFGVVYEEAGGGECVFQGHQQMRTMRSAGDDREGCFPQPCCRWPPHQLPPQEEGDWLCEG